MHVETILCRQVRRRPRVPGERCGGFVARLPYRARVRQIIRHSDQAEPHNYVSACAVCGALHEIERMIPLRALRRVG